MSTSAPRVPSGRRLRVNPIACEGHGLCAELLPELIRLDEWGYPVLEQSEVPEGLLGLARRAADACPTLALLLERAEEGPARDGRAQAEASLAVAARAATSQRRTRPRA